MDPKSARLPHDLLRSLIVPEVAPLENHLTRTRHAQSGYHSSQHHNPHPNQYDQTTQAPEQAVQGHSAKRHTMSEFVTDFDMEPLPQTPSANIKMPNRPKSNAPVAENGKLYTLEEWDALFPIPKQPAPQPAQQPTQLATSGKAVPLPPKSTNPDAIPRFNHLCQVHSLTSSFTFTEVEQGLFASKLELGDYVYEAAGPFSSKKLAKEAVAARALPTLENIESPLAKNGKRGAAKRTSSANNTPDEENEDWIAVSHEFAQQHRHARPEFQFFEVDTRSQQQRGLCNGPVQYCCTLRIKARPDHAFGSDSMPHLSKAEAKRAAAKDAVTWLRAVDMLPDTASAPTTKRRKSSADEGAHTGLTQAVSRLKTDQSPAQLVAELSLRLGLSPPQYKCTPAGQNSYVCTAHFLKQDEERQPRLKGALCATPSVFGQKNAKKVCAGDLLAVLQRLTAEAGIGE